MAELSRDDVDEIALLARLALSDDEAERMRGDLAAILDAIRALSELDTEGVEPMTHAVPMALRLRPDEVAPSLPVDEAVGPAPARSDDLFQVPKIIE